MRTPILMCAFLALDVLFSSSAALEHRDPARVQSNPARPLRPIAADPFPGLARGGRFEVHGDTLPEAREAILRAHGDDASYDGVRGEPDGGGSSSASADSFAAPVALSLAVYGEAGRTALRFDVGLPARGGELEVYDVAGRRFLHRDLWNLGPGHHAFTISAGGVPAGIYWARVRIDGTAVTSRLVWIR